MLGLRDAHQLGTDTLEVLANCTQLAVVDISGCYQFEDFRPFKALPIVALDVSGCDLNRLSVTALSQLPQLKRLSLVGSVLSSLSKILSTKIVTDATGYAFNHRVFV